MSKPRVTEPKRHQGVIRFEMPDDALSPEHPARVLWQALGRLDLSAFLDDARSVERSAGRPTHSPRMMLTLWTFAISQGVGSAREIARRIQSDRAYPWIVGDVAVGHHALSKFRVGHQQAVGCRSAAERLALLSAAGLRSRRRAYGRASSGNFTAEGRRGPQSFAGIRPLNPSLRPSAALCGKKTHDARVGRFRVPTRRDQPVSCTQAVDKLMTDILAALTHKGVLSLRLVAQDGMRVRASASAPSFRTLGSLEECREQAELHLKAVLAQADDPELSLAQKAAREAGARDFQRRIEEAISTVETLQEQRGASGPPVRASTTDAEARVMKMADGGFRPGLNVQMATAGSELGGPRTVVAVNVNNVGSDMSALTPMLDQIERRTGKLPETLLADANHGGHAGIVDATARGVNVVIPVSKRSRQSAKVDPEPAIVAWKARMQTDAAKELYRARPGLAEWTNANAAGRFGLRQFLVRGVPKATAVALLIAITTNLTQHLTTLVS
jgi:transposase